MNHSLYLHIPFCSHRCAYCDFNTYAGQEDSIPYYVAALCREIEFVGKNAPSELSVHTVFFGGGTPSLLTVRQFDSILQAISSNFILEKDVEITMEANPGTVSFKDLGALRALGINRVSFGVQSADGEELRLLERSHNFLDVMEAISSARRVGFDNLNLDLIYGLPEQTLQKWQTTVRRILGLRPDHIAAYALTLEHGTPFGRWSARGLLPTPDPDLAAEMYEWASEAFELAGYRQYEISNWALSDHECSHNLQYWRALPYLGFGAGAHGYASGYRYSNALRIKTYIDRLEDQSAPATNFDFPISPAAVNRHLQTPREDMSEYMITGLRLTREGVSASDFRQRFGRELIETYSKEISELTQLGLLQWTSGCVEASHMPECLRLTSRGRLLGNRVFLKFLD